MASTGLNGSTWLLMANVTQGRLGVHSLPGQCCCHGYKCGASLSLKHPATWLWRPRRQDTGT